jgi:poly(A) polymerase
MVWPNIELAWSILLHDVGKPKTFTIGDDGIPHFYCHEHESAKIAEKILKRFKFSKKETNNIIEAVGNHMRFAHVSKMRKAKLKRLMASKTFPLQLELHRIDCISSNGKLDQYIFLIDILNSEEDEIELPKPLINGRDLIKAGISPGPEMGEILKNISDLQLEGELTTKDEAIKYALKKTLLRLRSIKYIIVDKYHH